MGCSGRAVVPVLQDSQHGTPSLTLRLTSQRGKLRLRHTWASSRRPESHKHINILRRLKRGNNRTVITAPVSYLSRTVPQRRFSPPPAPPPAHGGPQVLLRARPAAAALRGAPPGPLFWKFPPGSVPACSRARAEPRSNPEREERRVAAGRAACTAGAPTPQRCGPTHSGVALRPDPPTPAAAAAAAAPRAPRAAPARQLAAGPCPTRPAPTRTEPFSDPLSPSSASSSGSRRSGRGFSSSSSCCAKGAAIFPGGGGRGLAARGAGRGGASMWAGPRAGRDLRAPRAVAPRPARLVLCLR